MRSHLEQMIDQRDDAVAARDALQRQNDALRTELAIEREKVRDDEAAISALVAENEELKTALRELCHLADKSTENMSAEWIGNALVWWFATHDAMVRHG